MDWVHAKLPGQRFGGEEYEVWLDDGSVRTCRMQQGLYPIPIMVLTDCASPLANAVLDEYRVRAWRVTGRHPQQIALEGKHEPSPPPALNAAHYQQQASLRNNPMSALYQAQESFTSNSYNPMGAGYRLVRYV